MAGDQPIEAVADGGKALALLDGGNGFGLAYYMTLMFLLGPGVVVYGACMISRRKARVARGMILEGWQAIVAGIAAMAIGDALTLFLWSMASYLPH